MASILGNLAHLFLPGIKPATVMSGVIEEREREVFDSYVARRYTEGEIAEKGKLLLLWR